MAYLVAGLLALLLLAAAWGDIRSRTIPNGLNAAIALLAAAWWWANGWPIWPDVASQIGLAAAAFALFALLFAFGMMGGGDVKLIAALALWLPLVPFVQMLLVMAVAGGIVTLVVVVIYRVKALGKPEIPYGVAIAFAGLWMVANNVLTNSV